MDLILDDKTDSGWTFMETLVVISIILILTGTVGFMGLKYVEKARIAAAASGVRSLALALDCYRIDCGDYPTLEQGLAALIEKPLLEPVPACWNGPYLNGIHLADPWNSPWQYTRPGAKGYPYDLTSWGADRIPGGEGNGRDITLHE
jgi:general secretion pathway protein G